MNLVITKLEDIKLRNNVHADGHYGVWYFTDKDCGLRGYVAIHRKYKNKPSIGGTRFFSYRSETEALNDALRLSRAMSYKCVVSGLPYGGGKAVLIGDPRKLKSKALLKSYAKVVAHLNGVFYTGEDVGIEKADVQFMLKHADFFVGKTDQAGDPSPYAAESVFDLILAAIKVEMPDKDLSEISVAVKGLGKVGAALVEKLLKCGVRVVGADVQKDVMLRMKKKFPQMRLVSPSVISKQAVDIYAPCALGNEFTKDSIKNIKAKIICGSANNQLESSTVALMLEKNRILFVPDYLANAGGLINVADELHTRGYDKKRVVKNIALLKNTFNELYNLSKTERKSMYTIAELLTAKKVNA